jgi:hypothetical protein
MTFYQGVEVRGLWVHVVILPLLVLGDGFWALFNDLFYIGLMLFYWVMC